MAQVENRCLRPVHIFLAIKQGYIDEKEESGSVADPNDSGLSSEKQNKEEDVAASAFLAGGPSGELRGPPLGQDRGGAGGATGEFALKPWACLMVVQPYRKVLWAI